MNIIYLAPFYFFLVLATCVQRIRELSWSKKNSAKLKAAGFEEREPKAEYALIITVHVLWCLGLILEPVIRSQLTGVTQVPFIISAIGIIGFCFSQMLKYKAIKTLGTEWNVSIMHDANKASFVGHGPYKYIRHPNYAALLIEFFTLPLILGCYTTCIVGTILKFTALKIRIKREEQYLMERPGYKEFASKTNRLVPLIW